ncbi:hypothetical protein NG2371_01809 [Nocardia gamkensis]|nr:hypothetical protein [Nocardia gamkensis]
MPRKTGPTATGSAQARRTPSRKHATLAGLRAMMTERPAAFADSLRLARKQATALLSGRRSSATMIPIDVITDLRHIRVEYVFDQRLPSAGFWDTTTRRWVIQIAATVQRKQQRVAVAREFKHVLDYHRATHLYLGNDLVSGRYEANRAAEYFAGQLLVPSRLLRRAWKAGLTTPEELSDHFVVPEVMIRQRLAETRLGPYASRTTYHRPLNLAVVSGRAV